MFSKYRSFKLRYRSFYEPMQKFYCSVDSTRNRNARAFHRAESEKTVFENVKRALSPWKTHRLLLNLVSWHATSSDGILCVIVTVYMLCHRILYSLLCFMELYAFATKGEPNVTSRSCSRTNVSGGMFAHFHCVCIPPDRWSASPIRDVQLRFFQNIEVLNFDISKHRSTSIKLR